MGKTSAAVKNRYARKAYDRILLQVKKGKKDQIQRRAELLGLSVNGYINSLIDRDTAGLDLSAPPAQGDQGDGSAEDLET